MVTLEKLEDLAKRRGFFWQASEIYGGIAGLYDYGHLGFLLKKKWEDIWRHFFLGLDDNFFEIQPTYMMPEQVFRASGHLESFVDPICKCKKCGAEERADHIVESVLGETFEGLSSKELTELIKKHKIRCHKCKGEYEEVSELNMMFPLKAGSSGVAYLRPETAQGPYVNFRQEFELLRRKMPMGLAVVGKAFRNEISPRQLLIRTREFTQAELQIFFNPGDIDKHDKWDSVKGYEVLALPHGHKKAEETELVELHKKGLPKFYLYHMAMIQKFYLDVMKIPKDKFRFRELGDEERAFYNKYHWDIELNLDSLGGFKEMGGLHYRTDHDLAGHAKVSKQKMTITADGKSFVPHVLELSFGVDRNVFALIEFAYREERDQIILKFPINMSPVDAAVFPLVNKDGMPEIAQSVYEELRNEFTVMYDESGSIGRRYARQDEIGTPFCITVDSDSVKSPSNRTVTVRNRDDTRQVRVPIQRLSQTLKELISGEKDFEKAGKMIS